MRCSRRATNRGIRCSSARRASLGRARRSRSAASQRRSPTRERRRYRVMRITAASPPIRHDDRDAPARPSRDGVSRHATPPTGLRDMLRAGCDGDRAEDPVRRHAWDVVHRCRAVLHGRRIRWVVAGVHRARWTDLIASEVKAPSRESLQTRRVDHLPTTTTPTSRAQAAPGVTYRRSRRVALDIRNTASEWSARRYAQPPSNR